MPERERIACLLFGFGPMVRSSLPTTHELRNAVGRLRRIHEGRGVFGLIQLMLRRACACTYRYHVIGNRAQEERAISSQQASGGLRYFASSVLSWRTIWAHSLEEALWWPDTSNYWLLCVRIGNDLVAPHPVW
jgi:hypothetical protein